MAKGNINVGINVSSTGAESVKKTINSLKELAKETNTINNERIKSEKNYQKAMDKSRNLSEKKQLAENKMNNSLRKYKEEVALRDKNTESIKKNEAEIERLSMVSLDSNEALSRGFDIGKELKKYKKDYSALAQEVNKSGILNINTTGVTSIKSLMTNMEEAEKILRGLTEEQQRYTDIVNTTQEKINALYRKADAYVASKSKNGMTELQAGILRGENGGTISGLKQYIKNNPNEFTFGQNNQALSYLSRLSNEMIRLSKEDGFQKTNETLNEVNSKVEAYEKYLAYCNSLLDEMDRKWKKVSGMEGLEKTNASMEKQNMKLNNSIPKDEENLSKNVSAFRDLGNDSQGAKEGVEGATKALSSWKVQLGLSIGKGAIKLVKNFYEKFKSAFKKVQDVTKQFEKKFVKAMKSISHVFRYMIMRMSFRALLKDWQFFFNKYLEFSEPFLQSFNELYNAVLRVTASLITAFAPVITALQPVITSLANAVRYLLDIIAQFNAVFFLGSDNYDRVKDFWVDYSDLLDKAGGSAKKAGKQLAAFDTINKLGSDSGGGSKSTLDDLLNPEDIYENSPLSEFWRNIKNMFEQKKFKDIGASFADAFNTWVDNALTVFDEGNFSEKLNGKIDGVRQALTSFFSKINEDPDGPTGPGKASSYKLGTLAGKIVNMISSGIITALTDDDGTTWYGEFARAIGLFLQGAIDEIKFEDLGMVVISLRNMINRFWTEFWGTLNEEVLDENGNSTGQTYAQKLGDGLATAFNTAIENWDMEAEIGKTVEKFTAIIDAAIEFLDNAKIFEGAMKRGYAVGNAMGQLASRIMELFAKALWAAVKDLTGYILGALAGAINGAAENAKDDSLLEASAKALIDALGVIIGAALVTFWPGLIGKAIGGALMLACGVDFLGNQKGLWTAAFEGLGEDAATSVENGMMNEDTGMRTVLDNVFGTTVAYAAELEPTVEEEFKAVGEGATEAMGEPMLNEDTGVLSKLNTLFDSVKTAISDKQSSTEEQGKSWGGWIVSGLASGLSAGLLPAGPLMTALTSLSGTIASKFTKFFEIGSPSKLFERYGGWIIEGLNNGLQGEDVDTGFTKSLSGLDTENQEIANSVLTTWNDFKLSLEEIFISIGDMIKTQLEMVVTMLNVTMHTVQSGLNNMVSALNDIIEDYNRAAKEAGGRTISYVGYVRLEDIPIPKLASGAVIPPNNEFLAVLGDQKHGTNIEAPLDTIKQALAEVLGSKMSNREVVLEVDSREFGRAVLDLGNQEQRRIGTKFITA